MMKKIWIIGIGMGNPGTMTMHACELIKKCGAVAGAERMLDSILTDGKKTFCSIAPFPLLSWMQQQEEEEIAVLMSGDTGFFSGAKKLTALIEQETDWETELIPGVSSLQYFCAKLKLPWEDVKAVSLHGRQDDFIKEIRSSGKVFLLTDTEQTPAVICRRLTEAGYGTAKVYVGERLSYPDEKITGGTGEELAEMAFHPLSVVLVENDRKDMQSVVTHGLPDEVFIRGKVPMTKEEVRSVTLSKLSLCREDILYDIGAGTGSVSVEMALQADLGCVYAIESNGEAADLVLENKKKMGASNLHVIRGTAPQALEDLPPADKAFIGGSRGNLRSIIQTLLKKNPAIRIVINAIALETLAEAVQIFREEGFAYTDVVQITASRAKAAGSHHLMMGQNPVFILTGEKKEAESCIQ